MIGGLMSSYTLYTINRVFFLHLYLFLILILSVVQVVSSVLTLITEIYSYTTHVKRLFIFIDLELDRLVESKIGRIVVDGSKRWSCEDCDYSTPYKQDMKKHVERRHIDMHITCPKCSTNVGSRYELKTHMRERHRL